jgi:hypothetical protein
LPFTPSPSPRKQEDNKDPGRVPVPDHLCQNAPPFPTVQSRA